MAILDVDEICALVGNCCYGKLRSI